MIKKNCYRRIVLLYIRKVIGTQKNNRLYGAGCSYEGCKQDNLWKNYLAGAITKEIAAWIEETERTGFN